MILNVSHLTVNGQSLGEKWTRVTNLYVEESNRFFRVPTFPIL